jgi:glucose-1-phosphate thymidylyltransferase
MRRNRSRTGIAQAFLIGADFIGGSGVSLILGDNIFYGKLDFYREALAAEHGACVFGYQVRDPERYGVVEFDETVERSASRKNRSSRRAHSPCRASTSTTSAWSRFCRELRHPRGELEITISTWCISTR